MSESVQHRYYGPSSREGSRDSSDRSSPEGDRAERAGLGRERSRNRRGGRSSTRPLSTGEETPGSRSSARNQDNRVSGELSPSIPSHRSSPVRDDDNQEDIREIGDELCNR